MAPSYVRMYTLPPRPYAPFDGRRTPSDLAKTDTKMQKTVHIEPIKQITIWIIYILACRCHVLCRIGTVQTPPRKHVLEPAHCTDPTRHDLLYITQISSMSALKYLGHEVGIDDLSVICQ